MPKDYFPPLPQKAATGDMPLDQLLQELQRRVNTFYRAISFTGGTITVVGADGVELEISAGELLFRSGHASETDPANINALVADIGGGVEAGFLFIQAPEIDSLGEPQIVMRSHPTDTTLNLIQLAANADDILSVGTAGIELYSGTSIKFFIVDTEVARFTADGLRVTDGDASNPSIGFTNADTTGFYLGTNGDIGVTRAGSLVSAFTADGLRGLVHEYSDFEAANRTFTNTSYLDLDALTGGSGTLAARSVTVDTGTSALVIVTAATVRNSTAGSQTLLGYRVSGASTIAADDREALRHSIGGNTNVSGSFVTVENGLTGGTNTFELQARVTANTGWLDSPRITVIPL